MIEFLAILGGVVAFSLIAAWVDHVVGAPRRKRKMEKLLNDIREGKIKPKPRKHEHEIKLDENGASIVSLTKDKRREARIEWMQVVKANAYKRDLFAIDCLCIFLSRSDDTGLEADEQMQGWTEFTETLPTYLSGCKPTEQWWKTVAYPAFATNLTEIFSRTAVESKNGGPA